MNDVERIKAALTRGFNDWAWASEEEGRPGLWTALAEAVLKEMQVKACTCERQVADEAT